MSRRLLKFSGGSVDELRDVLHINDETKLLITDTERCNELRHGFVSLQSTEALDGFKDAHGDPGYHHLPAAPFALIEVTLRPGRRTSQLRTILTHIDIS